MKYLVEILRVRKASNPHEVAFGRQAYRVRVEGGRYKGGAYTETALTWVLPDLQALQEPDCDGEIQQRVGNHLRTLLGEADWGKHEAEIEDALKTQPVYLTICTDAAEVFLLPWELMTFQAGDQHIIERKNMFLGYAWLATQTKPGSRAQGRVLLAWAGKSDAVPWEEHQEALIASNPDFTAESDILAHVTPAKLDRAFEQAARDGRPISVLHLLCHGQQQDSSSGLAMDDGFVSPRQLRQLLEPYADQVRMVVLCACHGGDSGEPGTRVGSVAQALHRVGIQWVIASRYPWSVRGSSQFTEIFYQHLYKNNDSPEQALSAVRRALALGSSRADWASLQLYVRHEDREARLAIKPRRRTGLPRSGPHSTTERRTSRRAHSGPIPTAHARTLTVTLRRDGDRLESHYTAEGHLLEPTTQSWSVLASTLERLANTIAAGNPEAIAQQIARPEPGEALFRALFGDSWQSTLLPILGKAGPKARRNPPSKPVRLRIATDDPLLAALPWWLLSWQSQRLIDSGWLIATTSSKQASGDLTMPVPASIVVYAPGVAQHASPDAKHIAGVREVLARVWPARDPRDYLRVVHDPARLESACRSMSPMILYVYADAQSLPDLAGTFQTIGHAPLLIYFNTSGNVPTDAWQPGTLSNIPLVIRRSAPRRTSAATTVALTWLDHWLGKGLDPVYALHEVICDRDVARCIEAATLAIHGNYRTWKTLQFASRAVQDRPTIELDRIQAKALVVRHIKRLVNSPNQRVMAVVAYGRPGNRLDLLREQLQHEVNRELEGSVAINWLDLSFPDNRARLYTALEDELRMQLDAEHAQVANVLQRRAPLPGDAASRVLWLNWGVFGPGPGHRPKLTLRGQLEPYLRFASDFLTANCPRRVRLISYLAIETDRDKKLKTFLDKLLEQSWCTKSTFRLRGVSVDRVETHELLEYLHDQSSCPPSIQNDLARGLMSDTDGDFDQIVAHLGQIQDSGWYDLLCALDPAPPAHDDDEL